jgi:hypothetical protein
MGNSISVPDDALWAMCNIVAYFVQRQQIVVQAMAELAPPLLKHAQIDKFLGIDIDEAVGAFYKADKYPEQFGVWNKVWKYRRHGIGCELVHIHTGEPIEWDAVHVLTFDVRWFGIHLDWRIDHQCDNPDIVIYTKWLSDTNSSFIPLDYLVSIGFLYWEPMYNGLTINLSYFAERQS